MFPRVFIASLLLAYPVWADSALPDDFEATYQSLSGLVDAESLGAMDMARGTYDASRFFAVGKPGLPPLEQRFRSGVTLGQATVAGLYLTVWGQQTQFDLIRGELERNTAKRRIVYSMAGTEDIFFSSLESGATYQPMLRLLPSVGGTRMLTRQLLDSKDALVRRGGMFWGYWLADRSFWKRVKEMAGDDPDAATRTIAQRLVKKATAQAP
jgi:hypothetical protein